MKALITALMIALATVPGWLILLAAAPVSAQFKSRGGGGEQKDQGQEKTRRRTIQIGDRTAARQEVRSLGEYALMPNERRARQRAAIGRTEDVYFLPIM